MNSPDPPQASKAVLVTGAGRGIGRAIAERLAACGHRVGIADVDRTLCAATATAIATAGGTTLYVPFDASERAAFLDAAQAMVREFGRLDGVINNAMWIRYQPICEVSEDIVDKMVGVGLKGSLWGAQALLSVIDPRRGGSIVNLASPAADHGIANASVYTAVKGGIAALTRQLAVELGPRSVRVNAIAPGAVPTPGARTLVDAAGYESRRSRTPLGRLGTPEDIAGVVAFLLSDDASFITGEVIHVDGGISVSGP